MILFFDTHYCYDDVFCLTLYTTVVNITSKSLFIRDKCFRTKYCSCTDYYSLKLKLFFYFLLSSLECCLFNIVSLIYYKNLYNISVLQCFPLTSDAVSLDCYVTFLLLSQVH